MDTDEFRAALRLVGAQFDRVISHCVTTTPAAVMAGAGEGILLLTLLICILLARVPYLPIQISKTINDKPTRLLFTVNTIVVGLCLLPRFCERRALFAFLGCGLLPLVGAVPDAEHVVAHTAIAALSFACFTIQLWLWNAIGWLIVACQVANILSFLPTAWTHEKDLESVCPPALWPFTNNVIQWCKWDNIPVMGRLRGALQWISILVILRAFHLQLV